MMTIINVGLTKLFILLIVGSLLLSACGTSKPEKAENTATPEPEAEPTTGADDGSTEPDRGDVLEAIRQTAAALEQDAENAETRLQLANLHYQAGHFWEVKDIIQPLVNAPQPAIEALLLAANVEYLCGDYGRAEEYFNRILEIAPDDVATQLQARVMLGHVYYQTNQYTKTTDLFQGIPFQHPFLDLARAFGKQTPYQVEWNGTTETTIPFLMTDPLPIIPVEVQGKLIYAIIDTGGDMFVLDDEIAAALGIEAVATDTGSFAGGLQTEFGLGRADALKIGDVTLKSVPVMLGPTQRFSEALTAGQYTIGGILTTDVLKQFLPTIDYVNGALILRPKSAGGQLALQQYLEGKTVTEVPFVLAETHYMLVKGTLNDQDDLTFFVDSGLADTTAAMIAPVQTLRYVGIPVPETDVTDGVGGFAGGGFATGYFPVARLGLGTLIQKDQTGVYGIVPADKYWAFGFILDGYVSHNYLRQYAWSIDFSAMNMLFAQ